MKIKKFLIWLLCGSVTFVLTACYGGPVRVTQEKRVAKNSNETIKGLSYKTSAENEKAVQK